MHSVKTLGVSVVSYETLVEIGGCKCDVPPRAAIASELIAQTPPQTSEPQVGGLQ